MTNSTFIKNVAILANPLAGGGRALKIADWLKSSLELVYIKNTIFVIFKIL